MWRLPTLLSQIVNYSVSCSVGFENTMILQQACSWILCSICVLGLQLVGFKREFAVFVFCAVEVMLLVSCHFCRTSTEWCLAGMAGVEGIVVEHCGAGVGASTS